jgi:uncharacterized SAM-binding protein YcdF (DUF218 family)
MPGVLRECAEILTGPLALATLLGIVGLVCLWCKRVRAGRALLIGAALLAYCGASPIVGAALIRPLEAAYPPLREGVINTEIKSIVVMGSGYTPRDSLPVTAALDMAGLVRIVEGIRLMRRLGVAKLVLSGGAPPGQGRPALGYALLARDLGVPDSSLVILDQSQNTAAEAQAVRALLGEERFIIVTSAVHMPRAMRLMEQAGAHPIAAPTGQLIVDSPFTWRNLFPNSGGLYKVEVALHEYLGLAAMAAGIN